MEEMKLCGKCGDLDIISAVQETLTETKGAESSYNSWIEGWHSTLLDIYASSDTCPLCRLVIKGWRQHRPIALNDAIESGDMPLHNLPDNMNEDIVQIAEYRTATAEVYLERSTSRAEDGRHKAQVFLHFKLRRDQGLGGDVYGSLIVVFRVATGGVSVEGVEEALVAPNPLSDRAIEIAKTWLNHCSNHHASCASKSVRLPTRFLDVSESISKTHVFLRELRNFEDVGDCQYVALSHCWGVGNNFSTTHSTLESHKGGIEIRLLPKTFRDAIVVVRELGMRFIWIDSLCIIQDDVQDWQRESGQMASIYRDAHLVLSASCGHSDLEGFLNSRLQLDIVQLEGPSKSNLYLQLQPPAHNPEAPDSMDSEPLAKRAWCLQEKYLARRILQYGSLQMAWECQELQANENGDAAQLAGDHLGRIRATANVATSLFNRRFRYPLQQNRSANCMDWYQMIEDYTVRGITRNSDRLPALIGLAKATVESSKDEYLAGIWKSSMIEGLSWCSRAGTETLHEPGEYIAPSWSWASVIGAVRFPLYTWYDRASWAAATADFEPLAFYAEHELLLQDEDPMGRLRGGSLTLNVFLWPVVSIEERQDEEPDLWMFIGQQPHRSLLTNKTIGVYYEDDHETREFWIEGGFDKGSDEDKSTGDLFVLFLARLPFVIEFGFTDYRFGLIVERVKGGDAYRRVGFVDGMLLRKVYAPKKRREMLEQGDPEAEKVAIQGFVRPLKEDDRDMAERLNDLAYNPLEDIYREDVKLV